MRLKKIRIEGFQSFADSGEIEFLEGFNLIIGQNNSGKSAMLRAMLPALPDDRHRKPERWEQFKLAPPRVTFNLEASGLELRDWSLRSGSTQHFPLSQEQHSDAQPVMNEIFASGTVSITASRVANDPLRSSAYPSHGRFEYQTGDQQYTAAMSPDNGELQIRPAQGTDSLPELFWVAWQTDMFYFSAERLTIGESGAGYAIRLDPNAGNLPSVVHTLRNERGDLFNRLVAHVREIFSTVGNLSVRTRPENNNFEIRVWPTAVMERVELSFPLNASGTGVAQVIAILTAIMTVENAVIIIDEINTFLHPAAIKALLRILQTEYSHHQYIISTHAPEVIGFSHPKTIHLVKRDGYDSLVKRLNLDDVSEFREVAEHLGVSMADVFAADRVIWVEGPTEEICFPYLYQKFTGRPIPKGTIITSVTATGDFNRKRDRKIVYEVYSRLSSAAATLLVATVFSFDTEELTKAQKLAMVKDSAGRLNFLPRRHIECYLINPGAVANMIVAKDPGSADLATAELVAAKLSELASGDVLKISEWAGDLDDINWLAKVDGARLIALATASLSEQRATFNKKEDSLTLLKYIMEKDRENLTPLFYYVQSLVMAVTPVE